MSDSDFDVLKPGAYVPIEVAQEMAGMLDVARCPNNDCIQGIIMLSQGTTEQCQWCAERAVALANLK